MRNAILQGAAVALGLIGAGTAPPPALDKLRAETATLAIERASAGSVPEPPCRLSDELRKLLERLDKRPSRPAVRPTEK